MSHFSLAEHTMVSVIVRPKKKQSLFIVAVWSQPPAISGGKFCSWMNTGIFVAQNGPSARQFNNYSLWFFMGVDKPFASITMWSTSWYGYDWYKYTEDTLTLPSTGGISALYMDIHFFRSLPACRHVTIADIWKKKKKCWNANWITACGAICWKLMIKNANTTERLKSNCEFRNNLWSVCFFEVFKNSTCFNCNSITFHSADGVSVFVITWLNISMILTI